MRQILFATALALTPVLATAEEAVPEDTPLQDFSREMQDLFGNLLEGIDPALDGLGDMFEEIEPNMRAFLEQMGPALRGLVDQVEDWSAYHPPEVLDNGDIIIRRKAPTEQTDPEAAPLPDGVIDL